MARQAPRGARHPLPRHGPDRADLHRRRTPPPTSAGDRATTGAFQPYGRAGRHARSPASRPAPAPIYRLAPGAEPAGARRLGLPQPGGPGHRRRRAALRGHARRRRARHPAGRSTTPTRSTACGRGPGTAGRTSLPTLLPLTDAAVPARRPSTSRRGTRRSRRSVDLAASGLAAPDRSLLVAATEPHAALGGMTFVPAGGPFARWAGQLLISEMGDFKPHHRPGAPRRSGPGSRWRSSTSRTGRRTVFARNRGEGPAQPASRLDLQEAFERPVDVKVGPGRPGLRARLRRLRVDREGGQGHAQDRQGLPHRAGRRPARDRPALVLLLLLAAGLAATRPPKGAPTRGPPRRGRDRGRRGAGPCRARGDAGRGLGADATGDRAAARAESLAAVLDHVPGFQVLFADGVGGSAHGLGARVLRRRRGRVRPAPRRRRAGGRRRVGPRRLARLRAPRPRARRGAARAGLGALRRHRPGRRGAGLHPPPRPWRRSRGGGERGGRRHVDRGKLRDAGR